jgi:hypothetical protein
MLKSVKTALIVLVTVTTTTCLPLSASAGSASGDCHDDGESLPVSSHFLGNLSATLGSISTTKACSALLPESVYTAAYLEDMAMLPECLCGALMGSTKTVTRVAGAGVDLLRMNGKQATAETVELFLHPVEQIHAIESTLSSNMKDFGRANREIKTALVCDTVAESVLLAIPVAAAAKLALAKQAATAAATEKAALASWDADADRIAAEAQAQAAWHATPEGSKAFWEPTLKAAAKDRQRFAAETEAKATKAGMSASAPRPLALGPQFFRYGGTDGIVFGRFSNGDLDFQLKGTGVALRIPAAQATGFSEALPLDSDGLGMGGL